MALRFNEDGDASKCPSPHATGELKELVMGLHWTPTEASSAAKPADLDALCVLFDGHERVLEVVCPAHPRNGNGSVIHTGDSRRGASEWDDERIFVFLDALPEPVSSLAFVVVSATGRAFSEVRGASCHISDRFTEHEWIRLELTNLGQQTAHCVATLYRGPAGWTPSTDTHPLDGKLVAEIVSLAGREKGNPV